MNLLDGMAVFFLAHNVFVIIVMGELFVMHPLMHYIREWLSNTVLLAKWKSPPTFIYKGQSVETDNGQLYSNREENELLMN